MKYFIWVLVLCFIPSFVYADVRITEIAWMGVAGDSGQYGEWLEFYNSGSEAVPLSGWKIFKDNGTKLIYTLGTSIAAGGYLVLERTTATMLDPVLGIQDEAGPFGSNGLSNTGEALVLKDAEGHTVETLAFAAGWPAGDSATKQTMQWNGSSWITADATPKIGVQATAISTTPQSPVDSETKHIGAGDDPEPIPPQSPNKPHAEVLLPDTLWRGVPYTLEAKVVLEYGLQPSHGIFYWNFGDGSVAQTKTSQPILHTYLHDGSYTIYFSYSPSAEQQVLVGSKVVTVSPAPLTLELSQDSSELSIKNTSATPIDISGWKLESGGARYQFPLLTIIAPHAAVTFMQRTLALHSLRSSSLYTPADILVSSTIMTSPPIQDVVTEVLKEGKQVVANFVPTVAAAAPKVEQVQIKRNRTKTFVISAAALFVIGLCLLLERFMVRQE
jgi:hypothetical protein